MAKRHLEQYDSDGNLLESYLNTDEIKVGEGKFLDKKLSEIDEALDEAGSGSVNGVQVGETIYRPNENGVVDMSTPMADKVDKEQGKGLSSNDYTTQERNKLAGLSNYDDTALQAAVVSLQNALAALVGGADVQGAIDTFNEVVAFLSGISSSDTLAAKLATLVPQTRTVNGKALSGNVTIGINDIEGLANALANAGSGNVSVIQPDPADGTFIIRVGENDFTINLNHTHPEYAPLVHTHSQYAQVQVVNGESNLPATLDPKTIYGVKADGVDELEMVVIGGYKFYGGGGGAPGQPVLMKPDAGSTIVISGVDNGYSGNVLDPKSVQVYIKARNITQPISVSVSGTGFSIENSVNQISAADALAGVNINVLFDGSANSQGGTLLLQSTELGQAPRAFDLSVEYVTYEALSAVGLRGSQWMETDYIANTNTNIKMVAQFTPNANTRLSGTEPYLFDSRVSGGGGVLSVYFGNNGTGNDAGTYNLNVATDGSVVKGSYYQQLKYHTPNTPDSSFCNKGTFLYSGTSASFSGENITTKSCNIVRQTRTADAGMVIGKKATDDGLPVNAFDVDIYGIEITEGNTAVRNFIPIKKDGVPGLYDTINGTFHPSASGTRLAEIASNNS